MGGILFHPRPTDAQSKHLAPSANGQSVIKCGNPKCASLRDEWQTHFEQGHAWEARVALECEACRKERARRFCVISLSAANRRRFKEPEFKLAQFVNPFRTRAAPPRDQICPSAERAGAVDHSLRRASLEGNSDTGRRTHGAAQGTMASAAASNHGEYPWPLPDGPRSASTLHRHATQTGQRS